MRTLLAVAAVAAAVFFGVPAIKEGTTGECAALAARIVSSAGPADKADADTTGMMSLFAGALAEGMVTLRYPNVPSGLSCAALYWRTLYDPAYAVRLQQ